MRKTAREEEGMEKRILRLLIWYGIAVFAVSGTLELVLPRLDMPVVSLLLILLPYGFLAVLLARAPALLRLARSRYAGSDLDAAAAAALADRARMLLKHEYIWSDPGLSLQILAEYCASSPRDLSQAINQTYGIGVPAWINGFRLENAKNLLAETDRKVADIAFEVGFNSLSSFNSAFKERTGPQLDAPPAAPIHEGALCTGGQTGRGFPLCRHQLRPAGPHRGVRRRQALSGGHGRTDLQAPEADKIPGCTLSAMLPTQMPGSGISMQRVHLR
jgi:AraC-like DNA-binding protein